MHMNTSEEIKLKSIESALQKIRQFCQPTPLSKSSRHSKKYSANVFFKREDLQEVRSYKIRGAYNKMSSLNPAEKRKGDICASAGNHSQGVAYSCKALGITGTIFMPITTPSQKVEQVKMFGEGFVEVVLYGDTFDDAKSKAINESIDNGKVFIHPFDDPKIIEGQATVGLELMEQTNFPIDYIFVPIGGGGLVAGLITVLQHLSPYTVVVGVEPEGAASMSLAIDNDRVSS